MPRAAIYCRISEDRKGEELGVDRQLEDCLKLCEQRGWTAVENYIDNDKSAKGKTKRPRFEALMGDVGAGTVDVIVTWIWDRISRNRRDDLTIMEACQPRSIVIALVRGMDIDLSTPAGRLVADMLASAARFEIDLKGDRQRLAAFQAAQSGLPTGGPRAFGYADGMHLDLTEAPVVFALYQQFLAGASLGSLTRWLNDQGMKTPRGNPWRYNSLREMLANPRNAGLKGVRYLKPGSLDLRERWHQVIGPAQWPGIVEEATWRAAMEVIMDPARRTNLAGNARRYLLSNLALCGAPNCGKQLVTGRRDGIRTLRCPTLAHVSRRADYIEEYVEEAIFERLRAEDAIDLCQRPVDGPNLAVLRDERIAIRKRLDGMAESFALLGMDQQQVAAASGAGRKRIAEIDQAVAAAGRVDVVAQMVGDDRDPADVWDGLALDVRRALVATVLTSVRVLPGRSGRPGGLRFDPASVELTWRRPGSVAEA